MQIIDQDCWKSANLKYFANLKLKLWCCSQGKKYVGVVRSHPTDYNILYSSDFCTLQSAVETRTVSRSKVVSKHSILFCPREPLHYPHFIYSPDGF